MLKELNDKRIKARAAFRLALHQVPDSIEKDIAWEAADEYMRAEHQLVESLKTEAAILNQGDYQK